MKTAVILSILLLRLALPAGAQNAQPQFTISTFAGNGTTGYSGDGGPAIKAELSSPLGVAVDQQGNVYVADSAEERVRKIATDGTITTVAGSGAVGFSGDGGLATQASMHTPVRVAVDAAGNIYIADANNYRIRVVTPLGIISTYAGNGNTSASGDGGLATAAGLNAPRDIALDAAGNLYIVGDSNSVRKVTPAGIISTVAGNGTAAFSGDGGPAVSATLNQPKGIAVDSSGNLYISDQGNQRVRKVSNGIITTVAGNGTQGFAGDGGDATKAELNAPTGICIASGNLYITDNANNRVRVLLPGGTIWTVAGNGKAAYSGDGGPAASASLNTPRAVAADPSGAVYVADPGNAVVRLLVPVPQPPTINVSGVVPVYSTATTIQPGSWVSIYGTGLATSTTVWNGDFPTKLANTSVTINGKPAYLWFVSPTQINLQAPDDTTRGPVSVIVTTPYGAFTSTVTLGDYGPSFSLFNTKYPAAIVPTSGPGNSGAGYDYIGPVGGLPFTTRPVRAGETLLLYGVGFGPTTPVFPAGKATSGAAPSVSLPQVTIGGVAAQVNFAGIVEAGLYQFNVVVPSVPSGDQSLVATIGGQTTPNNVYITIQ